MSELYQAISIFYDFEGWVRGKQSFVAFFGFQAKLQDNVS